MDTASTNDVHVEKSQEEFVSLDPVHEETTVDQEEQDDFNDFDDDNEFDNGFVNADDNDDEFGDFDDFEPATDFSQEPQSENDIQQAEEIDDNQPTTPTEATIYTEVLENSPEKIETFIEDYLKRLWINPTYCQDIISSPVQEEEAIDDKSILNTTCSRELWDKLSQDTIFHNSVTGAVGQFQWTRSETNKAYLNALGVTFSTNEKPSPRVRTISPHLAKKQQFNYIDGKTAETISSDSTTSPSTSPDTSQIHPKSSSATAGLSIITTKIEESEKETKKEVDQDLDLELDIDIARAYCELTEETIRVFPDVKLNAMVAELTRLQKQAAEYLEHLLDQKEQLLMDAETYNDLISCIVGHAQRLREQNPNKDASPAMVSKKKKSSNSSFSNIMRRKTTSHATQSVSMGGGVVGVQQPQQTSLSKKPAPPASKLAPTAESRRSM
ncbi:hypothetical protein RMATCC62417_01822 [Rhizopus microsporus]|nr:hypothetical protein RMATCC62417_01822 [Rhizopus microsporus]